MPVEMCCSFVVQIANMNVMNRKCGHTLQRHGVDKRNAVRNGRWIEQKGGQSRGGQSHTGGSHSSNEGENHQRN